MGKSRVQVRTPSSLAELAEGLGTERDALMKGAAALQLTPANATKAIRLQRLLEAVCGATPSPQQRPTTRARLRELLTSPPIASRHIVGGEDDFEEPFTAHVAFHGGGYQVVSGGIAGSAAGCQLVLSAANSLRGGRYASFAAEVARDAVILLALSNRMCLRAGLPRWATPAFSSETHLVVPPAADLAKLVGAVTFSNAEIDGMFGALASHVDELVVPGPLDIVSHESDGPTDDRMYLYPLVRLLDGDVVVALAGGVALSITHRALCRAGDLQIIDPLWNALHGSLRRAVANSLDRLAWTPRPAPRDLDLPQLVRESFYSFDDDKLAHVVGVVDPLEGYRPGHPCDMVDLAGIEAELHERFAAVRDAMRHGRPRASVLHLVCHAPLGLCSSVGFRYDATDEESEILYMGSDDLDVISRAEAPDPLALWKFARASARLHKATRVISTSALDEYAIYRKNGSGFYMSDDALPDVMIMAPGSGGPLRVRHRQRVDQHLVRVPDTEGFVEVVRWDADDATPIYQPELPDQHDHHLVELQGPCWVVPTGESTAARRSSAGLAQGAAFWLWRSRDLFEDALEVILARHGRLVVEVSFVLPSGPSDDCAEIQPTSAWMTCQGFPAEGKVRMCLIEEAGARLQGHTNDAERAIAARLVSAIHETAGLSGDGVYESVLAALPCGMSKMMHVFDERDDLLLNFGPTRRPRLLQDSDVEMILDEIGLLARNRLGLAEGAVPQSDYSVVLNGIVAGLFERLVSLVASLDPAGLLEELLAQQEAILYYGARWSLILPGQAACFGEYSSAVVETVASERQVTSTAIGNRFLIECVTASPPAGDRQLSLGLYDEAMALAKQIVEFGMLSDAIFHKLSTAELALLPSGRFGVSRDDPYHEAYAAYVTLMADRALPGARRAYPGHWDDEDDSGDDYDPTALNEAFAAEFGVTAQELSELSGELMRVGASGLDEVVCRDRGELITELVARLDRTEEAIVQALDVVSLGPLERFPPDRDAADVYPWRFSRNRSMARRPVLLRPKADGAFEVIIGSRAVLASSHYLLSQIHAGRIDARSDAMKAYVTGARQAANAAFNRQVARVFRAVQTLRVSENVNQFGKLKLARANGDEIGDIDVLVISPPRKVLLLVEVKDFELARTPAELANEIKKLLIGKKSAAYHHAERVAFIKAHISPVLEALNLTEDAEDWRVADGIVTSHDLISAHFPVLESSGALPRILSFDALLAEGPDSLLAPVPAPPTRRVHGRRGAQG